MKYVIDTKDIGLKFEPQCGKEASNMIWEISAFSDSDWAGDKDNRKSVSEWIVKLLGCPISYKSRQQVAVSLINN